jgi:hypothetical protein
MPPTKIDQIAHHDSPKKEAYSEKAATNAVYKTHDKTSTKYQEVEMPEHN